MQRTYATHQVLLALVSSAASPRLRAAAVSLLHALWVDRSPSEHACPRLLRSWATLQLPQLAAAPLVARPAAVPTELRLLQPLLLHVLRYRTTTAGDTTAPGGGGGSGVAAVSDGWSPRLLMTPRGAAHAVEVAAEATPLLTCAALRLVGTLARRGW